MIVNKVANSGLITLDLEQFLPKEKLVGFDLKDHLFMGLILKEKEFRDGLKNLDWSIYKDAAVAVFCSVDAIIPVWAYMLVASYLQPQTAVVFQGTEAELTKHLILKNISGMDVQKYNDQRLVIKGCGEIKIEDYAYLAITEKLLPVAKSIMYGEPCSTVPIFKRKS